MSAPALRQRAAQGPANGSVQRSERSIQARATASRNKTPLGTDSRATNGVLQTFPSAWRHSVNFDITGDGVKDRTAWNTGSDAFLAVDLDGNGKIDGVQELFGGLERGQGFAQLSKFDSNGDGKVDNSDVHFGDLLLWQDKNADGVTDAGELVNAANAGLTSISTQYRSQEVSQHGNLFGEVSTAVWRGREVNAVDVYYRYSSAGGATNSAAEPANRLVDAMSSFDVATSGSLLASSFNQLDASVARPGSFAPIVSTVGG